MANIDKFTVFVGPLFKPEHVQPIMHQDMFHMAKFLGNNLMVLLPNLDHEEANYIILVDTRTGNSIRVVPPSADPVKVADAVTHSAVMQTALRAREREENGNG